MIEILWHGRGGQGAFTAARLLGAAGSLQDGRYGLAFPSFGPERRGAPMRAFTKLDTKALGDRSAITKADYVVYLDASLLSNSWENELKQGGLVLVNSAQTYHDERIVSIDASGISRSILGRDIPNTVFLAALSVLCDALDPEDAKEAIRQYMAPKLHAKNIEIINYVADLLANTARRPVHSDACARAHIACTNTQDRATSMLQAPTGDATDDENTYTSEQSKQLKRLAQTAQATQAAQTQRAERVAQAAPINEQRIICKLVDSPALDPETCAQNTCWQAGFLVAKNAGWRTVRPVLDAQKCTGCLQCYMQCPDGTIYKTANADACLAIDYDFCKGCGICAAACSFDAICMVPEQE